MLIGSSNDRLFLVIYFCENCSHQQLLIFFTDWRNFFRQGWVNGRGPVRLLSGVSDAAGKMMDCGGLL
jgi:hypothetical protein